MDVYPSADQVAIAIITASREVGADPIDVVLGNGNAGCKEGGGTTQYAISRARAYAAFALRTVFTQCGAVAIGRMVGSRSPSGLLASLDAQMRNKSLRWWDDKVFMRVASSLTEE